VTHLHEYESYACYTKTVSRRITNSSTLVLHVLGISHSTLTWMTFVIDNQEFKSLHKFTRKSIKFV